MNDGQKQFHLWAFTGFIQWAASNPEMVKAFEAKNGKFNPPKTVMDAMIDKATGHNRKVFESFVKFCAAEYGEDFLPSDFLEQISSPTPQNGGG